MFVYYYNDFCFKIYVFVVFCYFWELFGIWFDDYLYFFCSELLIEFCSFGVSGFFFYVFSDDEFIIKIV